MRSCLSCFSSMPGADNVYMAKLAEQAERYEEMVRAPRRRRRTAPPLTRLPTDFAAALRRPCLPRALCLPFCSRTLSPVRCVRAPRSAAASSLPAPQRAPHPLPCLRPAPSTCRRWLTSLYLPTSPYISQVEYMKEVAKNAPEDLSLEERNLLSVAYKNVVGARRG